MKTFLVLVSCLLVIVNGKAMNNVTVKQYFLI